MASTKSVGRVRVQQPGERDELAASFFDATVSRSKAAEASYIKSINNKTWIYVDWR